MRKQFNNNSVANGWAHTSSWGRDALLGDVRPGPKPTRIHLEAQRGTFPFPPWYDRMPWSTSLWRSGAISFRTCPRSRTTRDLLTHTYWQNDHKVPTNQIRPDPNHQKDWSSFTFL